LNDDQGDHLRSQERMTTDVRSDKLNVLCLESGVSTLDSTDFEGKTGSDEKVHRQTQELSVHYQ